MTGENNKKGCNNKTLINTWMLASMVCMLSVSDMFGMKTNPKPLNPHDVMKKIKEDPEALEAFYKIFEGHEDLIKKNCWCCGGINVEDTMLPKSKEDCDKLNVTLASYIQERFILIEEGKAEVNVSYKKEYMPECGDFDNIILEIYKGQESDEEI